MGGDPVRQTRLPLVYRTEVAPGVTADSAIQCGHPCVTGTRVTTDTIADLHSQGETIEVLCEDYDLTVEQVNAAVAYETSRVRAV
jgi:uncharacterized protein (DUF433 family)